MCMYIYYIYCIQSWSFSPKLECYFIDTLRIPSMFLFMKMKKTESSFKYIFEARKNIFKISNNICCIAKIDVLVQYLQRETRFIKTSTNTGIYFKRGICLWNNLPQSTSTKMAPIVIAAFFVFSACLIVMFIVLCLQIFFSTL